MPCVCWQRGCSLRCRPDLLTGAVDGESGAIHRLGEPVLAVSLHRHANACGKLEARRTVSLVRTLCWESFDSPSCCVGVHWRKLVKEGKERLYCWGMPDGLGKRVQEIDALQERTIITTETRSCCSKRNKIRMAL